MSEKYYLSIVVPVYNEENNIKPLLARLTAVLQDLACKYEIIFILDPCTDNTEQTIMELREENPSIKLIKMSRRFGQPACTMAGIQYASGDACVVIDADLQDPPELIKDMVALWKNGYHVVYAQRISREGETMMKRMVSVLGYWVIDKIADIKIPRNTGDFRLMSRRVINHLKQFKEHDAFLRGLVSYVGFNQIALSYSRDERFKGKGKYNRLFGSFRIGFNGIFSFSKFPLHFIAVLGTIIASLSFLVTIVYIISKLANLNIPWGNPTTVILISFLSGVQLMSLGIMGEYFARIFDEVKQRPSFIVDKTVGFDGDCTEDEK